MAKTKIGFVGVGSMGQCAHLKNYVTVPDCEVVAIAEVRPELARHVARKYGVPRVYETHHAMLAHEQLDGIVASQMFWRYGALVPELLEAGVPIFTEKPLAGSVEQAEKIVRAVEHSGTWLMVGYHKRSDPAVMYAKAEVARLRQTGELGKLTYLRLTAPWGDWVANGFSELITTEETIPASIATDPPPSDMDAVTYERYLSFVNGYSHQLNLLRHFVDEPYQVTYASPAGKMLTVQCESGVEGTIEMALCATTRDWQESVFISFERGWISLDLPAPMAQNRAGRVELFRDPGAGVTPLHIVPVLPSVHAMRQQAMNFVSAIRGECPPLCTAADALADLRAARQYFDLLPRSVTA